VARHSIGWVGLLLSGCLMAGSATAQDVGGLGGPLFGLATAPNGDLLVADAGAGILAIRRGEARVLRFLPGATDVSPIGRDSLWVTTGAAGGPNGGLSDTGQGLHRVSRGNTRKLINLFAFEVENNPAGGTVNSNPFDVQSLGGRAALVADAAGNDLLLVSNRDKTRVLAVFPNELVSTANIQQLAGCPSPAPFCSLPPALPAEPVPTSIAVGRDGFIYVGELKGFPAPTGESNIWRVSPNAKGAQCGASSDCVKVFDGGFTSIIDLAFGPDGDLYVAELDQASWAAVEIFQAPTGGAVKACSLETHTCRSVATGVPILTAITFGKDGQLWGTRNALVPGQAEVVRLDGGAPPAP
jgi:hypothetical protein